MSMSSLYFARVASDILREVKNFKMKIIFDQNGFQFSRNG